MKLYVMSKGVMELHIDSDTATVVQLVNRVTGSKHLFSRKPELELKVPGMSGGLQRLRIAKLVLSF